MQAQETQEDQGAAYEEENAQQHTDVALCQTYPLTDAVKARLEELHNEKQHITGEVCSHSLQHASNTDSDIPVQASASSSSVPIAADQELLQRMSEPP